VPRALPQHQSVRIYGDDVRQKFAPLGMSVADTAAFIKDEAVLWARVIRDAKVQGD
jgi:hypothetical protein